MRMQKFTVSIAVGLVLPLMLIVCAISNAQEAHMTVTNARGYTSDNSVPRWKLTYSKIPNGSLCSLIYGVLNADPSSKINLSTFSSQLSEQPVRWEKLDISKYWSVINLYLARIVDGSYSNDRPSTAEEKKEEIRSRTVAIKELISRNAAVFERLVVDVDGNGKPDQIFRLGNNLALVSQEAPSAIQVGDGDSTMWSYFVLYDAGETSALEEDNGAARDPLVMELVIRDSRALFYQFSGNTLRISTYASLRDDAGVVKNGSIRDMLCSFFMQEVQ